MTFEADIVTFYEEHFHEGSVKVDSFTLDKWSLTLMHVLIIIYIHLKKHKL